MNTGAIGDKDKDHRIAKLIYESALSQLQADKYAQRISELEKEIIELKKGEETKWLAMYKAREQAER